MPAKAGIDRPKTQVLQSYEITSADRDADKTASALGTECRRNASAVIQRPRIHILVSDNLEKARKIGIASIVARKDAPVHPRLFEANFKALPRKGEADREIVGACMKKVIFKMFILKKRQEGE